MEKTIQVSFLDIETNLLFDIMRMADILITDINHRHIKMGGHFVKEKKQNYNRFLDGIRGAEHWFNANIEADYWEGVKNSPFHFDRMRYEANELLKLIFLFIDRTCTSDEPTEKIFNFISSLKSSGLITQEDLQFFTNIEYPDQL